MSGEPAPAVPVGVWRHWKGYLYQVLLAVDLYDNHPAISGFTPVRELFRARDSTNATEGREMTVCVVSRLRDSGALRFAAWPVAEREGGARHRPGVVYMGLTLDGDPTPGLRVRVRYAGEFLGSVDTAGGESVPRFAFLGAEWSPTMRKSDDA